MQRRKRKASKKNLSQTSKRERSTRTSRFTSCSWCPCSWHTSAASSSPRCCCGCSNKPKNSLYLWSPSSSLYLPISGTGSRGSGKSYGIKSQKNSKRLSKSIARKLVTGTRSWSRSGKGRRTRIRLRSLKRRFSNRSRIVFRTV